MADFRSHITTSSVLGIGYGVLGYSTLNLSVEQSILSAGLCGLSGMLPDLDSESGIPARETMAMSAAIVPMLLLDRFRDLGLERESLVLAGAAVYLAIRFGLAELFHRYTVHRGMWHSIPAAGIAGLLCYLMTNHDETPIRLFKSGAVVLGFISHLVLDELWSIDFAHALPRKKRSFGTALKFWTDRAVWPNVSTYSKLILLTMIAFGDPSWTEPIRQQRDVWDQAAHRHLQDWIRRTRSTTEPSAREGSLQR